MHEKRKLKYTLTDDSKASCPCSIRCEILLYWV